MLAFLLPIWAWVLPFAGPLLGTARNLLAGARSRIPGGIGSSVLAVAVVAVLGGLLWLKSDAWWNPPPRTYTAAEIEASSLRAENAALRAAIAAGQKAAQARDASISHLADINNQVTTEMEASRAKALRPDAVLVPADDSWLRDFQRRGW